MLHQGMRTSWIFNSQHVTTPPTSWWPNVRNMLRPTMLQYVASKCYDHLAGACKYWANNVAICCSELLRLFGRDCFAQDIGTIELIACTCNDLRSL